MAYNQLGNFDPNMMRDPQYRKLVEDALQMKSNADQIRRAQETNPNHPNNKAPVQVNNNNQSQVILPQQTPPNNEPLPIPNDQPVDFKMSDFNNVQKYDNNSTVSKMQNANQTGAVNTIGSIWVGKEEMKKYFATKNIFKIKVLGETRYKTYRYRPISGEVQQRLFRMAEDVANFYPLMIAEGQEVEEVGNDKPVKVLVRDGKFYKHGSELYADYRKEIALTCLGIEPDEYEQLEQFSDPNFTILDIWGIHDVIQGVLERSTSGTSYFRIAFNQL